VAAHPADEVERMSPEGIAVDEGREAAGESTVHWIEPGTELVATAQDLVSYRRFCVLYDRAEAGRKRLLRPKPQPFLIHIVGAGGIVAAFETWADVVAWHDRTVISPGWQVLKPLPEMDY
jgi:hypothetical protein